MMFFFKAQFEIRAFFFPVIFFFNGSVVAVSFFWGVLAVFFGGEFSNC